MPLAPGVRLGSHEIFAPPGAVCPCSVVLTPDGAARVHTYSHMISELFVARGLT